MTVRELKSQLNKIDDDCTIMLQTPDGTQRDITKASPQGDHLTFWADSGS
jgi:hypothetical protein